MSTPFNSHTNPTIRPNPFDGSQPVWYTNQPNVTITVPTTGENRTTQVFEQIQHHLLEAAPFIYRLNESHPIGQEVTKLLTSTLTNMFKINAVINQSLSMPVVNQFIPTPVMPVMTVPQASTRSGAFALNSFPQQQMALMQQNRQANVPSNMQQHIEVIQQAMQSRPNSHITVNPSVNTPNQIQEVATLDLVINQLGNPDSKRNYQDHYNIVKPYLNDLNKLEQLLGRISLTQLFAMFFHLDLLRNIPDHIALKFGSNKSLRSLLQAMNENSPAESSCVNKFCNSIRDFLKEALDQMQTATKSNREALIDKWVSSELVLYFLQVDQKFMNDPNVDIQQMNKDIIENILNFYEIKKDLSSVDNLIVQIYLNVRLNKFSEAQKLIIENPGQVGLQELKQQTQSLFFKKLVTCIQQQYAKKAVPLLSPSTELSNSNNTSSRYSPLVSTDEDYDSDELTIVEDEETLIQLGIESKKPNSFSFPLPSPRSSLQTSRKAEKRKVEVLNKPEAQTNSQPKNKKFRSNK